mgnify:CR=1 FL=1
MEVLALAMDMQIISFQVPTKTVAEAVHQVEVAEDVVHI